MATLFAKSTNATAAKCSAMLHFLQGLCTQDQKKIDQTRRYNWIFNSGDAYYNDIQRNLFATIPYIHSMPSLIVKIDARYDWKEFTQSGIPIETYGGDETAIEKAIDSPDIRLFVWSVRIDYYFYHDSETIRASHGIILLADRKNKWIEVFDPNGGYSGQTEPLMEMLLKHFQSQDWIFKTYQFLPPLSVCPASGPQDKTGDSFCAAWSELYGYLRAKCPDVKPKQMSLLLLQRSAEELKTLLENWICFVGTMAARRNVKEVHDWVEDPDNMTPLSFWREIRRLQMSGNAPSAYFQIQERENES